MATDQDSNETPQHHARKKWNNDRQKYDKLCRNEGKTYYEVTPKKLRKITETGQFVGEGRNKKFEALKRNSQFVGLMKDPRTRTFLKKVEKEGAEIRQVHV